MGRECPFYIKGIEGEDGKRGIRYTPEKRR